MADSRIFFLQVVFVIEDQWFANYHTGTNEPPIRTERRYGVDGRLFVATDEEAAYQWAVEVLDDSDANHDGRGDLTRFYCIGIHQLKELRGHSEISTEVGREYGLHLPGFLTDDVDAQGVPLIRRKEQLSIFGGGWHD
jgi:hypothetical protein